jgi:hypothetical protein
MKRKLVVSDGNNKKCKSGARWGNTRWKGYVRIQIEGDTYQFVESFNKNITEATARDCQLEQNIVHIFVNEGKQLNYPKGLGNLVTSNFTIEKNSLIQDYAYGNMLQECGILLKETDADDDQLMKEIIELLDEPLKCGCFLDLLVKGYTMCNGDMSCPVLITSCFLVSLGVNRAHVRSSLNKISNINKSPVEQSMKYVGLKEDFDGKTFFNPISQTSTREKVVKIPMRKLGVSLGNTTSSAAVQLTEFVYAFFSKSVCRSQSLQQSILQNNAIINARKEFEEEKQELIRKKEAEIHQKEKEICQKESEICQKESEICQKEKDKERMKIQFERTINAIHKRPECAGKADNGINLIAAVKRPDHFSFCLITSNAPSGNIYSNLKSAVRRAKKSLPKEYEIYAMIVGSNDSMYMRAHDEQNQQRTGISYYGPVKEKGRRNMYVYFGEEFKSEVLLKIAKREKKYVYIGDGDVIDPNGEICNGINFVQDAQNVTRPLAEVRSISRNTQTRLFNIDGKMKFKLI